jgi:hypothetical protein
MVKVERATPNAFSGAQTRVVELPEVTPPPAAARPELPLTVTH